MELLKEYKVTLVTPMEEKEYELFKEFADKGCFIKETNFKRRSKNPFSDINLFYEYKKIMKEIKPELVITYTIKPNVYAGKAAASLKIPYFSNVTGLGTAFQKEGMLKKISTFLYKWGTGKANIIFYQNEESRNVFEKLGIKAAKSVNLPGSGINLNRFDYKEYPRDEIRLLYMARIMKDKGADEFLYCVEKIKEKYPEVIFDVVGSCDAEYKERLDDLSKKGIINAYGWRTDTGAFFEKCSLVIQPSYHEGMSNVCLEGAATGRPIVCSDIPGCKEAVIDKKSGFLVKVKDRESLLQGIEKFLALTIEEKKEMGICARKHIEENFDRKIVIDTFLREIKEVFK